MLNLPSNFLRQVSQRVGGARGARQTAIITAVSSQLSAALVRYEMDTDHRAAYWAGQVCYESDQFCTTVEYASGAAYEGRSDLGNVNPGDGVRYRGRGLIQLTGRANYAHYGLLASLDLINDPDLAADPLNALTLACLFWNAHGLSALADLEDLEGITKKINGGLNGLAQRQVATDRAFKALGYDVVA